MKIGHPKDFWSGMMFVGFGLVFALVARGVTIGDTVLISGYTMGEPSRMGPAFFPFWLGVILIGFGAAIAFLGVRTNGGEAARFPTFHWKPILFVLGAVVMFGLILKPVGMLLAGILLVLVSSLGDPEGFRPKSTLALGVGLSVFCALVFVWGLSLPLPLCPDIEAIQSAIGFCRG